MKQCAIVENKSEQDGLKDAATLSTSMYRPYYIDEGRFKVATDRLAADHELTAILDDLINELRALGAWTSMCPRAGLYKQLMNTTLRLYDTRYPKSIYGDLWQETRTELDLLDNPIITSIRYANWRPPEAMQLLCDLVQQYTQTLKRRIIETDLSGKGTRKLLYDYKEFMRFMIRFLIKKVPARHRAGLVLAF